jgi:hypothetical protein
MIAPCRRLATRVSVPHRSVVSGLRAVQEWEQGRPMPDRPAHILLRVTVGLSQGRCRRAGILSGVAPEPQQVVPDLQDADMVVRDLVDLSSASSTRSAHGDLVSINHRPRIPSRRPRCPDLRTDYLLRQAAVTARLTPKFSRTAMDLVSGGAPGSRREDEETQPIPQRSGHRSFPFDISADSALRASEFTLCIFVRIASRGSRGRTERRINFIALSASGQLRRTTRRDSPGLCVCEEERSGRWRAQWRWWL